MRIEHIAIWVRDLEHTREFYQEYFDASSNEKYHNPKNDFSSYFLSFSNGARIELMHKPEISDLSNESTLGIAHLAFSVGSKEKVDMLTERIGKDGYEVAGEPRTTGDGYYESVIKDPEGNLIEITV